MLISNNLQFALSIKNERHFALGFRFRKHFFDKITGFLGWGYPPQRFAAEKWVMRDDDPPVGRLGCAPRSTWRGFTGLQSHFFRSWPARARASTLEGECAPRDHAPNAWRNQSESPKAIGCWNYPAQRRFAAEKWVMRDDDPPVGRRAVARFL